MGNFECNSIEDLVFNRSFREWVLSPFSQEAGFWTNWVAANPRKTEIVNHSKAIIYALQINFKALSEEDIDIEIGKILQKLNEAPSITFDDTPENENKRTGIFFNRYFQLSSVAAIFIIVFVWFFLQRNESANAVSKNYDSFLSEKIKSVVEQANTGDDMQIIVLPDGSKVYLEPQSKLNYARDFSGSKREVFLVGEAFFEVKKNPSKPFLVYTNSIITKVLGTSFRVKAYAADKKASIIVRTGKVSVFKTENFDEESLKSSKPGGIVATPNQEVVYTSETKELNKIITEKPDIIASPSKKAFVFDGTPVRQVFRTMQDVYNIPMVYDEDIMSGCSLSATMGDEPFYEKLNLICKAINASYEMIDGQIVIVSKGCR